jgi:hypothetical protein
MRRVAPSLAAHALAGVLVLWGIVAISLPRALAPLAPGSALVLAPESPEALVTRAQERLARAEGDAAAREEARSWAARALLQAPLDSTALRLLGELGPAEEAEELMEAAIRRSLHETSALLWLLHSRYEEGDFASVARLADILLRMRPQFLDDVIFYLAEMAEDPQAIGALDRLMAEHPRWRDVFLRDLTYHIRDAAAPLRVFLPLRDTEFPPPDEAIGRYLSFLLQHKFYSFAYDAWRRLLPPDRLPQTRHPLFNGHFERPPSRLPFDWTIVAGAGVAIDIVVDPSDARRRALSLDYRGGRAEPHSVSELVKLAPGRYRMSGESRGEIAGRRGLHWRVACVDASEPLGESETMLLSGRDWRRFQFEFVVPETDCILQRVALELAARSPSEWIVSGRMLYADLAIEPAPVDR